MTTTFLLDSTIHRLEDLTNQEIFIVVYSDGDTIVERRILSGTSDKVIEDVAA